MWRRVCGSEQCSFYLAFPRRLGCLFLKIKPVRRSVLPAPLSNPWRVMERGSEEVLAGSAAGQSLQSTQAPPTFTVRTRGQDCSWTLYCFVLLLLRLLPFLLLITLSVFISYFSASLLANGADKKHQAAAGEYGSGSLRAPQAPPPPPAVMRVW